MKASQSQILFKQIAIKPELAGDELWEEVECLARFWRRRCFHSFVPAECPNGESDYAINLEHLSFALGKVRYYQDLLDRRDRTLDVTTTTERRRERSEDSTDIERRGRG